MAGHVVEDADLSRHGEAIRVLNNAAVPAVNELDMDEVVELAEIGRMRVILGDSQDAPVAGVLVTVPPGTIYKSQNYRWFSEQFDDFVYIDRVIVSPLARGTGVGRALYDDAIAFATGEGRPRIVSEVNVDPPNPESMAFHARLGFTPILERLNESAGKVVSMMVRDLKRGA
ncbi:GNAT family N-acetyltransferase [Acuticoccus kandeliae]|uniref:GNAT family N-acetyltransferase n=1 Tax=Acuticoccus kandeliae TaxID=2073160 RepID=UPI000D3E049E|nr:GNAT family N-acetyltransferase [Acuticoccus kandeliae]